MGRKSQEHLGQIGDYWLSRAHDRGGSDDSWCRTWFDKRSRQTRRVSLGTSDFREASLALAEWVVANRRHHGAAPGEVMIETVLLRYWNDHAQKLPSAETQRLALSYRRNFWEGRTVAEITPHEQQRFCGWLASRKGRRGRTRSSARCCRWRRR